ncbi:MAG TPA: BON domain-containing protein [Thermoguttaceae bacterium]|nr:BON domain-containing protein [Thermoguttaceae bacterium]
MRRLLVGLVVAAATALVPIFALAGNQEVAEKIAASLRQSGQLESYKVGVKYQDGTAWLRGQVSSREQMNTALRLVFQTPGVTRVVNDLTIGPGNEQGSAPSVQQVAGVVTPERSTRLASRSLSVPATFTSGPVQQVAATVSQMPMLAPQPMAAQVAQPMPVGYFQGGAPMPLGQPMAGPMPQYAAPMGGGVAPARYDQAYTPNYAWPSYAAYPNYAALTYPKQHSPTAWPYIGPFYPYPQVPLGWRKVSLEWHDGWWQLDFDDGPRRGIVSSLFRPCR